MNSSRLGMSLSTNPNVTHDTNKHRNVPVQRSVLLFGSMRAMSAAAVTSSIPTELPSIPTQPLASVPDASVLADIAPIPDAPVATVTEQIILATAGEPSFASLGLGGWTPVGWVQEGLEWLHISCGLPWWGAIIATTIVLRTLVFPLVIITQRNAGKLQNAMPKVQALQMKITEARQMGDAMGTARYTQDLVMLMKKEDVNPLRQMAMPLVQAPIFLSYFIGVRQMVNAPVESLQTGGLWWFTDLTMADPYFILPLVTCSTMALTIQLGIDGMNVNSSNSHIAKYALRAMPVVLFPFIMNFPTAMVVYWSATNLVSLIQVISFRIPVPFFNSSMFSFGQLGGHTENSTRTGLLQIAKTCQTR